MFTIKARHASVSNLLNNPQTISKASSRKTKYDQRYERDSVRESQLQYKQSTILPKIQKPIKNNETTGQFFQTKRKQKANIKQLSLAISKYILHRSEFAKKTPNLLSYDIMNVIQCFSMIDNNFQQLFTYINQDLKTLLYLTTNAELLQKYQLKEGELYKKSVEEIDLAVSKKLKEAYNQVRYAKDAKQQIQEEYSRYKVSWEQKEKKYLQQIDWLNKMTNKQYIKYIQEQLQQKTQRIQELQLSQKSLVRLRDQYEKEIQKLSKKIQTQLKEVSQLNTTIYDLRTAREQSEKIILKLRDRFDQFSLKMTGIKDIISNVQKENEQLKTERISIVRRAAVSFGQLTPRPKYKKIINFTEKQQLCTLKPTTQIVQVLLNKIGNDAFLDQFRRNFFDQKLMAKKQLHPKLWQAQKIRQQTQVSIAQSKSQLRHIEKMFRKDQE